VESLRNRIRQEALLGWGPLESSEGLMPGSLQPQRHGARGRFSGAAVDLPRLAVQTLQLGAAAALQGGAGLGALASAGSSSGVEDSDGDVPMHNAGDVPGLGPCAGRGVAACKNLLAPAAAGCPVLLVRREGRAASPLQGWSIIAPARWITPLWQALVFTGALDCTGRERAATACT
jgi:hypothetical protein